MDNKYLEIVPEENKEMFGKVGELLEKFKSGHSRIQIENFILNEIEYPTDYGRYKQACTELISRYSRVIDSYFDVKEMQINLKMKNEEIEKLEVYQKQLGQLQLEKMQLQYRSKQASLKDIVREAIVFYEVYQSYPQFHNISDEEEMLLEQKQWAHKALNMPLVFEERYGGELLKQMWGEDTYKKFLEIRRDRHGLLPREIFEVNKLLMQNEQKQIGE